MQDSYKRAEQADKSATNQNGSEKSGVGKLPRLDDSYEKPNPAVRQTSAIHDIFNLVLFVAFVLIGSWLINHFIFQTFNVVGPSMQPTLEGESGHDRVIVDRLSVTLAHVQGKQYTPNRGQIIVFETPIESMKAEGEQYIVKRVIGLPGERVKIEDCELKVYNSEHPNGFNPYPDFKNLASDDKEINTCVAGEGTDVKVPDGQVFVVGDHRVGEYSRDSRNGNGRASLGTVPLDDIVGPVSLRIWPFDKIKAF